MRRSPLSLRSLLFASSLAATILLAGCAGSTGSGIRTPNGGPGRGGVPVSISIDPAVVVRGDRVRVAVYVRHYANERITLDWESIFGAAADAVFDRVEPPATMHATGNQANDHVAVFDLDVRADAALAVLDLRVKLDDVLAPDLIRRLSVLPGLADRVPPRIDIDGEGGPASGGVPVSIRVSPATASAGDTVRVAAIVRNYEHERPSLHWTPSMDGPSPADTFVDHDPAPTSNQPTGGSQNEHVVLFDLEVRAGAAPGVLTVRLLLDGKNLAPAVQDRIIVIGAAASREIGHGASTARARGSGAPVLAADSIDALRSHAPLKNDP